MNPQDALLSDDQLDQIIAWCVTRLKDRETPAHDHLSPRSKDVYRDVWTQLMRSVAVEAGRRREPRFASTLLDHAERMTSDMWQRMSLRGHCEHSVAMLLHAGAPVTKQVAKMARSKRWTERHALAEGLRVEDPAALPLLQLLASDPERLVRQPAREKLAKLQEIPWWVGLFDRDPLAALDSEQAAALGPSLSVIVEFLNDARYQQKGREQEFVRAVDQLPDDAAQQVFERFLQTSWYADVVVPLVSTFLRRPIAAEVLWRVLDLPCDEDDQQADERPGLSVAWRVCEILPKTDPAHRHQLALTWIKRLCTEPIPEEVFYEGVHKQTADLLPKLWAQGADASALIEFIEPSLERNRHWFNLTGTLVDLIATDPSTVSAQLWRILEAIRDSKLPTAQLLRLLDGLPAATQDAFAERFADDPNPAFRCAALQRRMTNGAAEADGGQTAALERILADTAQRGYLFSTPALLSHFSLELRNVLQRGELSVPEAGIWLKQLETPLESDLEAYRAAQLAVLKGQHQDYYQGLFPFRPPGPWRAADLAIVHEALALLRRLATQLPADAPAPHRHQQLALITLMAMMADADASLAESIEELLSVAASRSMDIFPWAKLQYEDYCKATERTPQTFEFDWTDDDD